jgi:hypothetical protein
MIHQMLNYYYYYYEDYYFGSIGASLGFISHFLFDFSSEFIIRIFTNLVVITTSFKARLGFVLRKIIARILITFGFIVLSDFILIIIVLLLVEIGFSVIKITKTITITATKIILSRTIFVGLTIGNVFSFLYNLFDSSIISEI